MSLDYFDQAPFAFNGTIGTTEIKYLKKQHTNQHEKIHH